ncbi:hypothetical protein CLF_104778 [Clonorchis sinensis]|uniref:Uncharacterized protein n=1 Tax=Clonorchis sinensis TaxID=79923 RepID=G7YCB5_CLOSI|nr:hypothetical protein CLF_104778 [Clonorchis sinensis]
MNAPKCDESGNTLDEEFPQSIGGERPQKLPKRRRHQERLMKPLTHLNEWRRKRTKQHLEYRFNFTANSV